MLLARPNWAVYSRLVGEGDNLVKPLWNQVSKVNNAMMLSCERTWLRSGFNSRNYPTAWFQCDRRAALT